MTINARKLESITNSKGASQSHHTATAKPQNTPVRIISHNIRYATTSPFKGEELWPVRCPRLCSQLAFNSASPSTFICLQEVLYSQVADIHVALNDSARLGGPWSYIGAGRDDGKRDGEFSPIFYRPSIWQLVSWKTTWLSETPNVPSMGWDAVCKRILTSGVFEHRETKRTVIVMSTHFDHIGVVARQKSAILILDTIKDLRSEVNPSAVLLAGDFNSPPDDGAYLTMTSPESSMEDIRLAVPENQRMGNEMTFTSFGYVDNEKSRIDFIFSGKGDKVKYGIYAVLENRYDDGVFLSDHRACIADVEIWSD